jgi:hypothetical protein
VFICLGLFEFECYRTLRCRGPRVAVILGKGVSAILVTFYKPSRIPEMVGKHRILVSYESGDDLDSRCVMWVPWSDVRFKATGKCGWIFWRFTKNAKSDY